MKIKERACYLCGDTTKKRDAYSPYRCIDCKKQVDRDTQDKRRQIKLKEKFLEKEKGAYLCTCGTYYFSIKGTLKACINCRTKEGT